jgi:hypothetical protein
MKARHGPPHVGTMIWASRAALGANGSLNEMKSRIEQDHDQYLPYALIHPRGAAYAPLPQAPTGGAKVRSHPVV